MYITHATHAVMRSENDPRDLTEQWNLFITYISVGQKMLRASVYIRKRNANRKMTAGSLWFLRAVNESRPIKFLFEAAGMLLPARDTQFRTRPFFSGDPYYTVDTWATITFSRPRPAVSRCLTLSFVADEGTLPRFYLTGPSTDFLSSLCLS